MSARKFVACTFVVEGAGRFPVDMLRYDRCCPKGQGDVIGAFVGDNLRRVELMMFWPSPGGGAPTVGRWASFGWSVVLDSVKPVRA